MLVGKHKYCGSEPLFFVDFVQRSRKCGMIKIYEGANNRKYQSVERINEWAYKHGGGGWLWVVAHNLDFRAKWWLWKRGWS